MKTWTVLCSPWILSAPYNLADTKLSNEIHKPSQIQFITVFDSFSSTAFTHKPNAHSQPTDFVRNQTELIGVWKGKTINCLFVWSHRNGVWESTCLLTTFPVVVLMPCNLQQLQPRPPFSINIKNRMMMITRKKQRQCVCSLSLFLIAVPAYFFHFLSGPWLTFSFIYFSIAPRYGLASKYRHTYLSTQSIFRPLLFH